MGGGRRPQVGVRHRHLRGEVSSEATQRQMDVLAAYVAAGGSVQAAAEIVGIRPSTVKRHLADLRARSGLTTEQLIYCGRAEGWLLVAALEPEWPRQAASRPSARTGRNRYGQLSVLYQSASMPLDTESPGRSSGRLDQPG